MLGVGLRMTSLCMGYHDIIEWKCLKVNISKIAGAFIYFLKPVLKVMQLTHVWLTLIMEQ